MLAFRRNIILVDGDHRRQQLLLLDAKLQQEPIDRDSEQRWARVAP
jgi:hypothetical protein